MRITKAFACFHLFNGGPGILARILDYTLIRTIRTIRSDYTQKVHTYDHTPNIRVVYIAVYWNSSTHSLVNDSVMSEPDLN